MTNQELKRIINEIEKKERLTLGEIAEKAHVDRSNLSTFINLNETKPVSKKMYSRFQLAFATYFNVSNKPNTDQANTYILPADGIRVTLQDYIDNLKKQNQFLQELAAKKIPDADDLKQIQNTNKEEILSALSALNSNLRDSVSSALVELNKVAGERSEEIPLGKSKKNLPKKAL